MGTIGQFFRRRQMEVGKAAMTKVMSFLLLGAVLSLCLPSAVMHPAEAQQQDVTAPTLVSISSSPATVDVAAGPAPITVTAQLADDLAGVQQWLVSFSSPSGAQFLQVFGTPGLITGTNLNGTFQGTSMLPQFSESGVWQATFLSMTDNAGNNTSVNLASAGFPLSFTVLPIAIQIAIDIKPGSFPNSINPSSRGSIPVAILSSSTFNAPANVDKTSLTFGRTGNEQSLAFCNSSPKDVNGDGLLDQVCHFNIQQTGFQSGDTVGVLKGKTTTGTPIIGTDSVRIVLSTSNWQRQVTSG